jgi:hypothetical protein
VGSEGAEISGACPLLSREPRVSGIIGNFLVAVTSAQQSESMPAKVVPMSMAGRDSAEPFMRGVTETGSAPRAARSSRSAGGAVAERRGAGRFSGRAKRRERSHQSVTQDAKTPSHFVHEYLSM